MLIGQNAGTGRIATRAPVCRKPNRRFFKTSDCIGRHRLSGKHGGELRFICHDIDSCLEMVERFGKDVLADLKS